MARIVSRVSRGRRCASGNGVGGMVDNIMMASAGRGGAGLRGDQYYPPPPPPPFPRPCVSLSLSLSLSLSVSPCLSTPTTNLPSDSPSSFPYGATTIAISTLRMSGFSPFYRLPQPPPLARPSVSLSFLLHLVKDANSHEFTRTFRTEWTRSLI